MARGIQIDPPTVVSEKPGAAFSLSTVDRVIDYVRRHGAERNWNELRDAAFVAAAVRHPKKTWQPCANSQPRHLKRFADAGSAMQRA
jgi:hypothetical protein